MASCTIAFATETQLPVKVGVGRGTTGRFRTQQAGDGEEKLTCLGLLFALQVHVEKVNAVKDLGAGAYACS